MRRCYSEMFPSGTKQGNHKQPSKYCASNELYGHGDREPAWLSLYQQACL